MPKNAKRKRDVRNVIGVGRRPSRASQPQHSSEVRIYVDIEVEYNGNTYYLTLQELLQLPVNFVKKSVVKELKEVKPTVFGELLFGAADISLYTDNARQEEITGGTLMEVLTMQVSKEVPPMVAIYGRLDVASGQEGQDEKAKSEDKQLTEGLKALSKVTISKKKQVLPASQVAFPYPIQDEVKKLKALFVREAYKKMLDQIVTDIKSGISCFAISGTPGIGKSLFFIYILHQLISKSSWKPDEWKPDVVVYHNDEASAYYAYMMDTLRVVNCEQKPSDFLDSQDSLYIMDGDTKCRPFRGISIMLASPRAKGYDYYRKKRDLARYYFPVWDKKEILKCQATCYASLEKEVVLILYAMFGGVPRFVYPNENINSRNVMEAALADANAIKDVRNVGDVTKMFTTSHILLHIIVGKKDERPFQFLHVDFASIYVADQLCERRWGQMLGKMRNLLLGSPSVLSGHLFERYGHAILRGKSTKVKELQCKRLHDNRAVPVGPLVLNEMEEVVPFGRNSIPQSLMESIYYEAIDNFPAVDAVTTVGLFQFTVRASHPIRGIKFLKRLCDLYKQPALYFVVPPQQFNTFKKQKSDGGKQVEGLKQYVVCLPLEKKGQI